MAGEGAAFIDVGGESTRPGSDVVPEEEEGRRVLPVVKALAESLPGRVSIDTYKARVAAKALEQGAGIVNDISALRMDPEMVAVVRDAACPVILMHMLGEPKTMQVDPTYEDVVTEVYGFFVETAQLGGRPGAQGREPADRPRHRLRQDDGAQPRTASPARHAQVAGPSCGGRHVAQALPGRDPRHRPARPTVTRPPPRRR